MGCLLDPGAFFGLPGWRIPPGIPLEARDRQRGARPGPIRTDPGPSRPMIALPSRAPAVGTETPRSRNMEIENLRAAAICMTMFAHLGFTNPVASQWVFQAFPHFQGAA